jgi:S1-C subfamily serine protease
MHRLIRAFAALVLFGAISSKAASDTVISMPDGWRGSILNADDGSFGSCTAEALFDHGTSLAVTITKDQKWFARFANNRWRFTGNQGMPFSFRFDGGTWLESESVSYHRNSIFVEMPIDGALYSMFRWGKLLEISVNNKLYAFPLRGTLRVSNNLKSCFSSAVGPVDPTTCNANDTQEAQKPRARTEGSGSGFLVSSRGHMITNAHVVRGCNRLRVKLPRENWIQADIVTVRDDLDLALLKVRTSFTSNVAKIRNSTSVKLGEDVIVFGFPLVGALSRDGNLVVGNVSALSGLGDDKTTFQISVPIQPGNSGGPLLDSAGNLIGVVVSKLDAVKVSANTGDIPQNVNFAIKSNSLIEFLNWAGTSYSSNSGVIDKATSEIGADVQKYTGLVECTP